MTPREIISDYDRMDNDIDRGHKIRILAELNGCEAEDICVLLTLSNRNIPEFIPAQSTGLGNEKGHRKQVRKRGMSGRKTHEQCIYFLETFCGKRGGKCGRCRHPEVLRRFGDIERRGSEDACMKFKRKEQLCTIQTVKL